MTHSSFPINLRRGEFDLFCPSQQKRACMDGKGQGQGQKLEQGQRQKQGQERRVTQGQKVMRMRIFQPRR